MAAMRDEHVGRYLQEYYKYFRSYFSSSFRGNEEGRRYSARKVRELDVIAVTRLSNDSLSTYVLQRDAFRREFFDNFRDWMLVACLPEGAQSPENVF